MSVLRKCLLLLAVASAVFVILAPGAPAGQAAPGSAPDPAATATGKNTKKSNGYGGTDSNGTVTVHGRQSSSKSAAPVKSGSEGDANDNSGSSGDRGNCPLVLRPEYATLPPLMTPYGDLRYKRSCPSATPAAAGGVDAKVIHEAVAKLTLPEVTLQAGPPPEINRWNSYVIGVDLWLVADGPDRVSTTVTQQGITIQITAVRDKVVFDMGNGDQVTCTKMTAWYEPPRSRNLRKNPWKSPNCGYNYQKLPATRNPSHPQDWCREYTMTATAHWTVTWSVLNQSGAIPMTKTGSKRLPIIELHTLNYNPSSHPTRSTEACPNR